MNDRSESRHASRAPGPSTVVDGGGVPPIVEPRSDGPRTRVGPVVESGWIQCDDDPIFAHYHPPKVEGWCRGAVILCNAFGAHAMMLHNQYRALAEDLSVAGFAVLRFDYPGTGDSGGHPRGCDARRRAIRSLHAVADWLRERVGVDQISLFGALLGGAYALEVAMNRPDVCGVATWGAYPTGRDFLRAARAFERMANHNPRRVRPSCWQAGDEEFLGFALPRATIEGLEDLAPLRDRESLRPSSCLRHAAVVERGPRPTDPLVAESLSALGIEASVCRPSADIGQVLEVVGPVQEDVLDFLGGWWQQHIGSDRPYSTRKPRELAVSPCVRLVGPDGRGIREAVVRFGRGQELSGVLSDSEVSRGLAVIFVNGGSNHRVGINRNYTEWARRWAAMGACCLRMDLRGLGESGAEAPRGAPSLYASDRVEDVVEAVGLLAGRSPGSRILVIGLCAGAYHAFQAAQVDRRIDRLVMLNPLRFFGDEERSHEPLVRRDVAWLARGPNSDLEASCRSESFTVAVGRLARRARVRLAELLRRLEYRFRGPRRSLGARMMRLLDRGCAVDMVFNVDEAMVGAFARSVRRERERLDGSGRFSVTLIEDANHIFSPLVSQERLTERLSRIVERELASSTRSTVPGVHPDDGSSSAVAR